MANARLLVEYWTVEMDGAASCRPCDQVLAKVQSTLNDVEPLAEALGLSMELVPRTVRTWAEAVNSTITASPTIRAGSHELRPQHNDGTEERVWSWRGTRNSAAPQRGAVLQLLLAALVERSITIDSYLSAGGPSPYLQQYLTGPDTDDSPERGAPATDQPCAAS